MGNQNGFTMVEMIIAMAIGLVLMGGIYSNFMLQTKVQNFQSSLTDVTQDLTLVSQVMFQELKSAKAGSLVYTPGQPAVLTYLNKDGILGTFKYQPNGPLGIKTDVLCWIRPKIPALIRCDEVMRDLSPNAVDPRDLAVVLPLGFDVYSYALPPDPTGRPNPSAASNMWVVTLKGTYITAEKRTGIVTHTFKVWQRN